MNLSLPSITFEINDNENIIKNLDPNKSNGHIWSVFFEHGQHVETV